MNKQIATDTPDVLALPEQPVNNRPKGRALTIVCVVLIVLFTLGLCADLVNYFTLDSGMAGTAGSRTDGFSMEDADFSADMELPSGDADSSADGETSSDSTDASADSEMPSDSTDASTDSEMPSGDMDFSADGEMPSGDMDFSADGEMPSGDMDFSADGEMPSGGMDFSADGESSDLTDASGLGDAAESTGTLYRLRVALRAAFLPVLIVCCLGDAACVFLLLWTRRKRKQAAEAAPAEEAAAETASATAEILDATSAEEDETPRRRKKPLWVVAVALILVAALVLGLLPRLSGSSSSSVTVVTEVLSSTAETGSIDSVLSGAGTLTEEDATEITVPDTVTVDTYYVSNGDTVATGDLIATVNKVSVGAAIVELQETLDELDEALAEAAEDEVSTTLAATAGGRVKVIYAAADDSVADVVAEYGSLMLISLDGLMAVDVTASDDLSVGDSVTVTLSDGTEETGRVAQLLDGSVTVTLSDETAAYGDTVTVTDEDGNTLGSGTLYIHSELRVLSYYGAVDSVDVDVDDNVDAGDCLLTLTDVGYSATYSSLLAQREELEEQMATLCRLYQDGSVYASCDGVVSGISDDATIADSTEDAEDSGDTATETAASGVSFTLNLLTSTTTASTGEDDDSSAYTAEELQPLIPAVTGFALVQTEEEIDLASWIEYDDSIIRYLSVDADELDLTTAGEYTVTFTLLVDQAALDAYLGRSDAGTGYILLSLSVPVTVVSETDAEAWLLENPDLVLLTGAVEDDTEQTPDDTGDDSATPNDGDTAVEPDTADNTDTTGEPDASGDAGSSDLSGGTDSGGQSGGASWDTSGTISGGTGDMSVSADDTTDTQTAATTSYIVAEQTLLSITPQDYMTISISVDELDILSLSEGQEATITLDALTGRSFTGTVTDIDTTGTNSGGNTKFAVEITVERTEQMLSGMNAAVKITLATTADVLVIPEAALVEDGNTTYVYTSYDEGSDTLGGLVAVETGVSDGDSVEILSGLSEGDAVYYSYADTLTYTFSSGISSFWS